MSKNRWTVDDFVQLARPKMMAAASSNALPHLIFEFFTEALLHYDDATVEGRAYIDKAMRGLSSLFEAEEREPESLKPMEMKIAIKPLQTLLNSWQNEHLWRGKEQASQG
jgi:hypothetical protein